MSPPPPRDPELTRARILDAATTLFVQQGFSDLSMSQLAAAAGVTKSLIHHHFGAKEQLWEVVKQRALEGYFAEQMQMLEAADQPGTDLLHASVVAYFRFLQRNPQAVRLYAWAHLEGDKACSEVDREVVRLGAERLREAQAAGLMRTDINPTHVIATFVMTCSHWFQSRLDHEHWPGIGDDDAFLDDFLKLFMDGLRPPEPS